MSQELAAQILKLQANAWLAAQPWAKAAQPDTSPLWQLYADWERETQSALMSNWAIQSVEMQELLAAATTAAVANNGASLLANADQWDDWAAAYLALLIPLLESGATIGADLATEAMLVDYALGLDASVINGHVADWARRYSGRLAKSLISTDKKLLRINLASWVESHEGYPSLVERLNKFIGNPARADLIASTEATQAYAEGNTITWEESGVVTGKIWNTAFDELVCPICKPVNQQMSALRDQIWYRQDGSMGVGLFVENPPAHPR